MDADEVVGPRPPPPPQDSSRLVSMTLTKKTLCAALNEKGQREKKTAAGLLLWSAKLAEENAARVAVLDAMSEPRSATDEAELRVLRAAMNTQADLRAVNLAGQEVRRILSAPNEAELALNTNGELATLYAAFGVSASVMAERLRLYLHPTRLELSAAAKRVRKRVLDSTVSQFVKFACAETQSKPTEPVRGRLPVFYVGAFARSSAASSRFFPMQRFLRLLSRRSIVLIVNENSTTKVFAFWYFFLSFFFLKKKKN